MPKELKLWVIDETNQLRECSPAVLQLEDKLEDWIEQDITVLRPDLLVIGRQVETDFGGIIDLLCIDSNGDTVVVELKRDRTPREITAQVLDYASWVRTLSNDRLNAIAGEYLNRPLEEAFMQKFQSALPDVLNENHSMLIVGTRIDPSTERIIRYLSETYGVGINVATFQYLTDPDGRELLARIFLLEPEMVEYQSKTRTSSKRQRNLTLDELQDVAEENGVGELYADFVRELSLILKVQTTRSSIGFYGDFEGSRKVVFNLIPSKSSTEEGLHFQIYFQRFCQLFNLDEETVLNGLPEGIQPWKYYQAAGPDYSGYSGLFTDRQQIDNFIQLLRAHN
ncbi:MAG: endonuclease NucS [Dehalococcoidia bacterium]